MTDQTSSKVAQYDGDDLEINPVFTITLKRWLKETSSSKGWYAFCVIYDGISQDIPSWLFKLITSIQKGLVSISD